MQNSAARCTAQRASPRCGASAAVSRALWLEPHRAPACPPADDLELVRVLRRGEAGWAPWWRQCLCSTRPLGRFSGFRRKKTDFRERKTVQSATANRTTPWPGPAREGTRGTSGPRRCPRAARHEEAPEEPPASTPGASEPMPKSCQRARPLPRARWSHSLPATLPIFHIMCPAPFE